MNNKNKKIIGTFILFFIFLLLTMFIQIEKTNNSSVSKDKKDHESIDLTVEHPNTKQRYKIVNAYKLFHNYIDKAKENPNKSQLAIYKEEVINPIYNDCFQNGEYLHMADSIFNKAPNSFTEIQILIDKIESEEPDEIIEEALVKSSDLLPSNDLTTVCVLPSTNNNSAVMVTVGAGRIIVLYNQYYTENVLRAGVAHEYHHSVWTEKYLNRNLSFSVLDNLIFEGKAVMFEKLVYPEVEFTPVDLTYNKDYWSKIAPDLGKYDLKRSLEIIMGGNELPWFYGYSEGYKMVQSYLELNPNVSTEEWTAIKSIDIFEKGKYLENYE